MGAQRFVTHTALVVFRFIVRVHVDTQRCFPQKSLVAHRTCKLVVACVRGHMPHHVGLLRETGHAHFTGKRLLLRVRPHMQSYLSRSGELFVAMRTGEALLGRVVIVQMVFEILKIDRKGKQLQ